MLTFKDEELGITYTADSSEELEKCLAAHYRIFCESIRGDENLAKIQLSSVVKNINPIRTPFLDGLGADKSIEQGDEALPPALHDQADPPVAQDQWLTPPQISEPPKSSPDAETEALAEAYQLQEHRQLQAEVTRLREGYETRGKVIEQLRTSLKESELAIEFVGQSPLQAANTGLTLADELAELQKARASLNHFNLDTSGIDKMLAQHGIYYHSAPPISVRGLGVMAQPVNVAPSKADVRMFQLWERFLEIMDANGFGDTPGEDRTSPDSYLSALEKWLVAFVQSAEQLQEERRKATHLLHERDNFQRHNQMLAAQADGMRKELGECKAEIVALKKGISKLQQKRESSKAKHAQELQDLIAESDLNKAEVSRLGDLYRQMQNQRDAEKHAREQAVNDNIDLSKRNKSLQEKLDFCLKAVPTLESAWLSVQPMPLS